MNGSSSPPGPPSDLAAVAPRHPRLQALLAFWEAEGRAAGGLPARRRFSFEAMRPWLGHLAVIAVERPALRFRATLVGTMIVEYDGRDNTGRYLDEAISAPNRPAALARYVRVAETGRWLADVAQIVAPDTTVAPLHRLLLPCAQDGRTVDAVLAAIYRESPP